MSAEFPASSERAQHAHDSDSLYTPHHPEQTLLYRTIREQIESFLARPRERGHFVPHFVEQELRAFLRCGILAHGFLRLHCDECRLGRLVPFSCKRRGLSPAGGAAGGG